MLPCSPLLLLVLMTCHNPLVHIEYVLGGIICALMKHFSFIVQQDETNLLSIMSALLTQVLQIGFFFFLLFRGVKLN